MAIRHTDIPLKGQYVVTEDACLRQGSGAYQHISIGFTELSKHFLMTSAFPKPDAVGSNSSSKKRAPSRGLKMNKSLGVLRDLKYFAKNSWRAIFVAYSIKREKPDFVYFRAHFLDPLPLLLKLLDVPFFIEANGLQFDARKKYYLSLMTPLNRWFEKMVYKSANYVFFVGSYGDYWQLETSNWCNVENGIESTLLDMDRTLEPASSGVIELAFVGRLMGHHNPKLLSSAIIQLSSISNLQYHLHLFGAGFEQLTSELGGHIELMEHGFLGREELHECLKGVDIGLISDGPLFSSQMKLFDYGAAKCVVIAASLPNLRNWFTPEEIVFFAEGSAKDLASSIDQVASQLPEYSGNAESLYSRIRRDFTWEGVFERKAKIIKEVIIDVII